MKIGNIDITNVKIGNESINKIMIGSDLVWSNFIGVLDQLSVTSAGAYSLRKLRANYTGSAIRVRRSLDNAEINIGFLSNGNLDTTSLLSFVGSGNGFVTTWYDQSGNNRNAIQLTSLSQPRIVNNGVIDTVNGKPSIKFNPGYFISPASGVDMIGVSLSAVFLRLSLSVPRQLFDWRLSTSSTPLFDDEAGGGFGFRMRNNANQLVSVGSLGGDTNPHIYSAIWNQSNLNARLDGGTSRTANISGVITLDTLAIGSNGRTFGANIFDGYLSEMMPFTSALSTVDRQLLEASQSNYYGIPLI